jgi:hypothetical protein
LKRRLQDLPPFERRQVPAALSNGGSKLVLIKFETDIYCRKIVEKNIKEFKQKSAAFTLAGPAMNCLGLEIVSQLLPCLFFIFLPFELRISSLFFFVLIADPDYHEVCEFPLFKIYTSQVVFFGKFHQILVMVTKYWPETSPFQLSCYFEFVRFCFC